MEESIVHAFDVLSLCTPSVIFEIFGGALLGVFVVRAEDVGLVG
jgi:hypothetical protein